jgi:hypothetical protein
LQKYDTATGTQALAYNTIGDNNSAVGNPALFTNSTGVNNSAVGYQSLYSNTTGSHNTATVLTLYTTTRPVLTTRREETLPVRPQVVFPTPRLWAFKQ